MSILKINTGVSSLGNYTDTALPLTDIDSNVKSIKTLVNGQWKSWTQGAPEAFQGVMSIDKGRGFVSNSTNVVDITVSDNDVNVNDININTGLNFLCFPFGEKTILNGLLPRVKVASVKSLLGTWKSWTKGAPSQFQGFNTVTKDNGYVCNVEFTYDNYLNSINRDYETGVRIGTSYANDENNVSSSDIVEFTPDSIYKSISYNVVEINDTLPLNDLWIKIGNVTKLIKYPNELAGTSFTIKETSTTILNRGTLGAATETLNYGTLGAATSTLNYGGLIGGYKLAEVLIKGIFTPNSGNSESNPLILDDKLVINNMEMMYDVLSIDANTVYKQMYIDINGVKSVIEFAEEYSGNDFIVIKDDVVYNSTFTPSNDYMILEPM